MKFLLTIFVILAFALPLFAFHTFPNDTSHSSIVPICAGNVQACTVCDLFVLIQSILGFLWWVITLPLAALFLAYGGVLLILPYLGGPAKMMERGRKVIQQALVGVLIVLVAWLAIDTIIKVVGQTGGFLPTKIGTDAGTSVVEEYGPWNEIKCSAPEISKPEEENNGDGNGNGNGTETGDITATADTLAWQQSLPPEGTGLRPTGSSYTCDDSGLVLYDDIINAEAAKNGISPMRMKAIILAESGGSVAAVSNDNDGKHSYSITQLRPETARDMAKSLGDNSLDGLSDTAVGNFLQGNPEQAIALGTKYYGDKHKESGNHNLTAAAYNGGPGANDPSVNCSGESSANGGTMRRWECEWDDNAHTIPNVGYQITRDYVEKVNTYENMLNSGTCS